MALVLPVIHDQTDVPDSAPSASWEVVSRTTGLATGVGPEINPLPNRGRAHRTHLEDDLGLVRYAGQLFFRQQYQLESIKNSSGNTIATRNASMVYRLDSNGWTAVSSHSSFLDPSTETSDASNLFFWKGDLYLACERRTLSSAGAYGPTRLAVFRYQSEGDWIAATATEEIAAANGGTHLDRVIPVPTETHLYLIAEETYPVNGIPSSMNRQVVYGYASNGWQRLAQATADEQTYRAVGSGSKVWFASFNRSYSYSPSEGLIQTAASNDAWDQLVSETDDFRKFWADLVIDNGVGSWAFNRYRAGFPNNYTDARQYYYLANNTGGSSWTLTRFNKPQFGENTSVWGWATIGDKEYVVTSGRAGSMTSGQGGIWIFRKDGASWTMLGGGSARSANTLPAGTYSNPGSPGVIMKVLGGVPYVIHWEQHDSSTGSFVIAKTAA